MSKKIYIGNTLIEGTDGKSAYQVWLDQGNIGTEAEFVESLKGEDGADGKDGKDGAPGPQGNTGSSVDYPYELVNNRTTNDATKGLSAAEGYRLGNDISQLGQEVDFKIDGDATIIKSLSWSNGYVNSSGKVVTSTASQFCQPVLLKEGETLTYKTGSDYAKAVVRVNDDTPVAVGNTLSGATIIVYANAGSTFSYTATEDMYIVISVYKADYTVSFSKHNEDSVASQIAKLREQLPLNLINCCVVGDNWDDYTIVTNNYISFIKGHTYKASIKFENAGTLGAHANVKLMTADSLSSVAKVIPLENRVVSIGDTVSADLLWTDADITNYRLGIYDAVSARRNIYYEATITVKDITVDTLMDTDGVVSRNIHKESALVSVAAKTGTESIKVAGKLTLLHFSDLHGNTANLKDIVQYRDNYAALLDDTIHTGDTVAAIITDTNPFTTVEGAGTILNVIGNHEAWLSTSESDYNATEKQTYDKIFAPSISGWGVTQPTDAAENGYCYYYKDYTTAGFRLIVLDSIHWHYRNGVSQANAAQKSWFEATLADARTQGLNVVCATHYTPQNGIIPVQGTGFNVLGTTTGADIADGWYAVDEMFGCVDAFITAGGKFSGWIVGHTHNDYFGEVYGHSGQPIVVIGTSRGTGSVNNKFVSGTVAQDNFNVITFETLNSKNIVKIVKIGQDTDIYLRSKNTISYNFTDGILLATN